MWFPCCWCSSPYSTERLRGFYVTNFTCPSLWQQQSCPLPRTTRAFLGFLKLTTEYHYIFITLKLYQVLWISSFFKVLLHPFCCGNNAFPLISARKGTRAVFEKMRVGSSENCLIYFMMFPKMIRKMSRILYLAIKK